MIGYKIQSLLALLIIRNLQMVSIAITLKLPISLPLIYTIWLFDVVYPRITIFYIELKIWMF